MSQQNRLDFNFSSFFALFLAGLGLGWLMGLSVSPVLQLVLTALLGTIAGVTAALSGIKASTEETPPAQTAKSAQSPTPTPQTGSTATSATTEPPKPVVKSDPKQPEKPSQEVQAKPISDSAPWWNVSPWPVAGLLVGMLAGSILGISARTHNTLGVQDSLDAEYSKWAAAGLGEEAIARRLFVAEHPYTPYMLTSILGQSGDMETKQAIIALGIRGVNGITQTEYITLTLDLTQTGDFAGKPDTVSHVTVANSPGISLTGDIVAHITSGESEANEAFEAEVNMWESLGLEKKEVARRLFDLRYPTNSLTTTTGSGGVAPAAGTVETTADKAALSVLFDATTPEGQTKCNELFMIPDERLREEMADSGVQIFQVVAAMVSDEQTLIEVRDKLCSPVPPVVP